MIQKLFGWFFEALGYTLTPTWIARRMEADQRELLNLKRFSENYPTISHCRIMLDSAFTKRRFPMKFVAGSREFYIIQHLLADQVRNNFGTSGGTLFDGVNFDGVKLVHDSQIEGVYLETASSESGEGQ